MKNKNPKREKRDSVNERFERTIKNSAFARLLTLIGQMDAWLKSLFSGLRNKTPSNGASQKRGLWRKTKRKVSKEIEQSLIFRFINLFFDLLLRLPVRAYGSILFASSVGMAAVASIKNYIGGEGLFSVGTLVVFLCAAVSSIFLLSVSKDKSLGNALLESRIFSYLLVDLIGIRKQSFETKSTAEVNYLWVLVFSLLLSASTILVPPSVPLFAILWVLFVRLAFCSPESGLITIFLFFPLLPNSELLLMVILVLCSYAVKIFRNKRTFRASFFGFVMLLYAILALFGTLMTPATGDGMSFGACFIALAAFFLSHLLLERREWLRRAMSAIVFGAVLSGLWIAVLAGAWLLTQQEGAAIYRSVFRFISENKYPAGMVSIESAAIYASAAISLLASRYLKEKKLVYRFIAALGGIALAAGAVLSQRPAAWFALAAALLALLIINKNFALIPSTVIVVSGVIVYAFILPKWITDYVSAFSGGFVAEAKTVGAQFASSASRLFFGAGEAGVDYHGNFFSHILTAQGLIGLLFFLFAVIGAFGFSYYCCVRNANCSRQIKQFLFGACASVVALLTAGVFYDLWIDPKLPFMLFGLMGLIFAGGRVLLREGEQMVLSSDLDRDYYFIPIVTAEKEKKNRKDRKKKRAVIPADSVGESEAVGVHGAGEEPNAPREGQSLADQTENEALCEAEDGETDDPSEEIETEGG